MSQGPDRSGHTETVETSSAEPPLGCRLRVLEGPDAGRAIDLASGSVRVGSDPACGLVLSDPTVSSQHLEVEVTTAGIRLRDLGSRNGSYYLESRLAEAYLPIGAVVRLGRTRLLLASRHPEESAVYSTRSNYGALVGESPAARRLFGILERIEPLDYPVLLLGETGTGKDLVAREIHAHSQRRDQALEVCDCAGIAPSLIESELFGHVRGAFTGAVSEYRGAFERAHGGTLFLDELGELPLDLQPKLLRAIETRQIRRVGGSKSIDVNLRLVAATNRDLAAAARDGTFRKDLYFRLNTIAITLPPLRNRREDIPVLLRKMLGELGHGSLDLSPGTVELFTTGYDWPGNIRELRHALERVLALGTLPAEMHAPPARTTDVSGDAGYHEAKKRLLDAFERDYVSAKLAESGNNISQAARNAKVERNYFKKLLRKHGLLGAGDAD